MRAVLISDTHTAQLDDIPDGDLLIHAGDMTFRGTEDEVKKHLKWMQSQPHECKVQIPGNHDLYFDTAKFPQRSLFRSWQIYRYYTPEKLIERHAPDVNVLIDRSIDFKGITIYGSPWQPWFHDWAFNLPANVEMDGWRVLATQHDREAAVRTWAKIPDNTNILVTHGPPYGILDAIDDKDDQDDDRVGCPELLKRIQQLEHLRLHVFGHIHEGYGRVDYYDPHKNASLTFANASINTRQYNPINAPIVVDL